MGYPYPYFCLCAFLGALSMTMSSNFGHRQVLVSSSSLRAVLASDLTMQVLNYPASGSFRVRGPDKRT